MTQTNTKQALLILSELNNDDLNWILQKGKKENLAAQQTLIYKGRRINALYIILRGTLSVSIDSKELARLGHGEIVGEISFIDNRPPTATVQALEESQVLSIPHLQLSLKLQKDEGFAARFYHGLLLCLSDRMRGTISRLGHGLKPGDSSDEASEDINPLLADRLELAEAKFNWLINYVGQSPSI
jgi:CRP/FNR family transcriptional regulator, cyclic AMP receptor protein